MDLFKQGMKGPSRPAPSVPGLGVNRYSPVTNWDDDPFGDVFEPTPNLQKKKPPPRPPPPKVLKQPDIPAKPSHFIRKPTVLSTLLSRKPKQNQNGINNHASQPNIMLDVHEVDPNKMFPKCEPKNVQTGALIDLSSPPSSPTFTTRSSSDGLSVDSFGSDATTSTNHHNMNNGGSASQAESGFEDDFDLFLNSRKISKEDTLDNFTTIDPFSSHSLKSVSKKTASSKDLFELSNNVNQPVPLLKGPTIIRAKPARPKPPDNAALLKNTFSGSFPVTPMCVNTTAPIHKVNSFGDNFDSKPFSWDERDDSSPEREASPPMPSIPPPPPPLIEDDVDAPTWTRDVTDFVEPICNGDEEPHAIALFDYHTEHPDDLNFSANTKITLIRRVDNEWLYGRLRSGAEGIFPSNYVDIKMPLPNETTPTTPVLGIAIAMYDFEPVQPGDLRFITGDTITVLSKLNDEWYFGQCNGVKGQFPVNYVQMS